MQSLTRIKSAKKNEGMTKKMSEETDGLSKKYFQQKFTIGIAFVATIENNQASSEIKNTSFLFLP